MSDERQWCGHPVDLRDPNAAEPVHWTSAAPTSLHGNGAASFQFTTRHRSEVTCRLCLALLSAGDGDEVQS